MIQRKNKSAGTGLPVCRNNLEDDAYDIVWEVTGMDPKKSIYQIIYIFIGLFVLVLGYFAYFMIARSNEIMNSPYNKRQDVLAEQVVRGEILSSTGDILAQTVVDEDGKERRVYPYDDLFVHAVGRVSKGITGIESTENIHLLTSGVNSFEKMYSDITGQKSIGNNVVTTLDTKLQQVAYDALGDRRGAVVVMEPNTGKILAMVSKPNYNPNSIDVDWGVLTTDENGQAPLINRATQGLYPPGSTFKLVTALAFMRQNPDYKKYKYNCDGQIEYNDMVIHCSHNTAHGKVDLTLSLAKSCNSSFANIGKSLDFAHFRSVSEELLFNKSLPVNFECNPSVFTINANSAIKEVMQTAIGQGNTLITPLHNAMIVSTIANGGVMMKPYLVDHIENANGGIVKRYASQIDSKPMSTGEASYLAKMMRDVVTEGTGTKLKDLVVEAAGKTGSADTKEGEAAHAWFVGYAPYDHPQIAVSIIVENVGTGSDYAVPIARKIFAAYFK